MTDYPDWQRAFRLVGTEITIPINIETSDVTLPITIVGAIATVDVNLAAQVANIDFNFADQSVAVFDAAKWFSHEAAQIFLNGSTTVGNNSGGVVASRAVPADKRMFVTGMGYRVAAIAATPRSMAGELRIDGATVADIGSIVGLGLTLDTPVRVEPEEVVDIVCWQWGSGASLSCDGSIWGYDEDV